LELRSSHWEWDFSFASPRLGEDRAGICLIRYRFISQCWDSINRPQLLTRISLCSSIERVHVGVHPNEHSTFHEWLWTVINGSADTGCSYSFAPGDDVQDLSWTLARMRFIMSGEVVIILSILVICVHCAYHTNTSLSPAGQSVSLIN
jgi:hypothetical protein